MERPHDLWLALDHIEDGLSHVVKEAAVKRGYLPVPVSIELLCNGGKYRQRQRRRSTT